MAVQTQVTNETDAHLGAHGEGSLTSPVAAASFDLEPVSVRLSGWGRFPVESCRSYQPASAGELSRLAGCGREQLLIARGLGRSYGDAALNRDRAVVSLLRLNKILAFDTSTGILDCEAGVSL